MSEKIVHVAPHSSNRECYHTDPECQFVKDTYSQMPEERAEKTLSECQYCADERQYENRPDMSYYEWACANE